jgi:hypothetical protein
MKLSNITFFQWGYPKFHFVQEDKPSQLTLSFLASIIHSSYFKEQEQYYKKEYHIPKEGLGIEHLLQTHEPNLYIQIIDELKSLTFYYDLPHSFLDRFYLLIAFNAFIDIPDEEYPSVYFLTHPYQIQEAIEDAEKNLENVSAIFLDHKISKEQMHAWIDENWEHIENETKNVLPTFPLEGKKFTNIEIADEILSLSENGKSSQEISDYLTDKYPDNPFVTDEGWIKNKLTRYKQWLNKIAKKYASLEHNQEE